MPEAQSFTPDDTMHVVEPKIGSSEISGFQEGDVREFGGERFRLTRVPTGKQVWDSELNQLVPGYHTLRTWFSHSTHYGPGPGWDNRRSLSNLTPEEMLQRYGYVFTNDEISAPGGIWVSGPQGEELSGGMPDDIAYFALEPFPRSEED